MKAEVTKAAVEPISGVIRVWKNPEAQYGDPYDWVATVRWITPQKVEVLGYVKKPTPGILRAVARALEANGVERVVATTYPNGAAAEPRVREFDVRRFSR